MTSFELDPSLKNDTHAVGSLETSEVLLMNDSRWLWLILVPRIADATEWHEVFTDQRQDIDLEIAHVASAIKGLTGCTKINIATLGNMVRQLHIHIVVRNEGDANWPGPVWGFGERVPYTEDGTQQLLQSIGSALDLEIS